ncbi:MAG: sulfite exporter TauE/SafE family protein [Corallococcus sp.]|nr:sulfite exporter TauE/SafE family protein [Bacillota bacterium]MCM1533132.1 sulfite exporter TauE/SafE family protein [Corallococcus sp.]
MDLTKKSKWILLVFSAISGFINGFLGGGGGVIVVALLLAVVKLDQKHAQATALLVILPLTAVSAIVYLIKGSVDWMPTLWVTSGVVTGGILGALLLSKLKSNVAKIIFALVLIAGGVKMFF